MKKKFLYFLFLLFSISALANDKNKKPENLKFIGYDLSRLDSLDNPDWILARTIGLPTIVVLVPKDLNSFSGYLGNYNLAPMFYQRFFLFPSGFGTDCNFVNQSYRRESGGYGQGETIESILNSIGIRYPNSINNGSVIYSPLFAMLQEELTIAFSQSQKFRSIVPAAGPMSEDLRGIEAEKRIGAQRLKEPLNKEPTADFFVGSSIGIRGVKMSRSTFRGDNEITNFFESIFTNSNSYNRSYRIHQATNIFRSFFKYKEETLVTVVVNIYISKGRSIIAGGSGLGITKIEIAKGKGFGGATNQTFKSEFLPVDAVRKAVQDSLENISSVK